MAGKKLDPKRQYEARGKRPGTPVGTRLTDVELRLLDDRVKAGEAISRSAWVLNLVRKELRPNEPPRRRKRNAD